MSSANPIKIYTAEDGQTRIDVRFEQDTVWLSQAQMVELFGRDQSVVSRHIRNAFKDGEIAEKSNMQKMHSANSDKPVAFYDLDVIISVGYRIKSAQGVRFRRWATRRLKEYLAQGYTLNQQRFDKNAAELQQALALIQKAAQSPEITAAAGAGLVAIVSRYTQTFLWLQRYDEGLLDEPAGQGVDAVLDNIGGRQTATLFPLVKYGGDLVSLLLPIVMRFRDALSPRNGSRAALLVDGDKHEFAFGHFDRFAVVG